MKRILAIVLILFAPLAMAQAPGVGLDSLPPAGSLVGSELLFGYQAGTGGSGVTVCARGWCPVSITPAQIASYVVAHAGSLGIALWTGSITAGDCARWMSAGILNDSGVAGCSGGGGGGVSTVSVVTANGLSGTVSNPTTTPAITLAPTFTGIASSNGSGFSAASVTGTGVLVQATSPTLVTPVLGVATATSINGSTIPTSAGTLPGSTGAFTLNHCLEVGSTSPLEVEDTGSTCGSGGGSGVSSAAAGGGITIAGTGSGPYTGAITVSALYTIRTVSGTSDTLLSTDCANGVQYTSGSAISVALPQATGAFANCAVDVYATGAGTVTVTPTTSTINGGATLTVTGGSYKVANIAGVGGNYIAGTSGSGGSGTVTSVGLSTSASWFTVGSSPITTSGTITINPTTGLTANEVLATPNGSSGAVGLRALAYADLPTIANNTFLGNTSGSTAVPSAQTSVNITTYLASPDPIGGTTPAAGAFTTLSATGNLTTNVTGSTQCLHANTSGVVSGTGSDCGSGGSTAFSALTGGTNTAAAMLVGTGASLGPTGSGTVTATSLSVLSGLPSQAAHSVVMNNTGGSASPTAVVVNTTAQAALVAATTFTITPTGCTPSAHAGGPFGGTITLASGPCTSIVVTMNGATGFTAPTGYHCDVGDDTTQAAGTYIPHWGASAKSTTTATIPIPAAAGATDVISFFCDWY